MAKELSVLQQQAEAIKTEVNKGANTSSRIGGMFGDMLEYNEEQSKINEGNTGVSEYPEFSEQEEYKSGDVVGRNGKLYEFKVEHPAGSWNETHVEATSIKKIQDKKLTELSNNVGLYNVDKNVPLGSGFYTSTTARAAVPTSVRKLGLIITYKTDSTTSVTEQFIGSDVSGWATDTNWKNVGSEGGNKILEWENDAATTRKQVPAKERKPGMQISYTSDGENWTNEQFIGTTTDDTSWSDDSNWELLPNDTYIKDLYGGYVDTAEYLMCYTDSEGRFLFGIKSDGSIEWSKGVPTPIQEALKKLNEIIYPYNSPDGYVEITTDSENRILSYRDKDGIKHETKLDVKRFYQQGKELTNIATKDDLINVSDIPLADIDGVQDHSLPNLFDKNNIRTYDSDFADKVFAAIGRKTGDTGCYSNNIECSEGDWFTRNDFGTGIIVVLDESENILGDVANAAYSPTVQIKPAKEEYDFSRAKYAVFVVMLSSLESEKIVKAKYVTSDYGNYITIPRLRVQTDNMDKDTQTYLKGSSGKYYTLKVDDSGESPILTPVKMEGIPSSELPSNFPLFSVVGDFSDYYESLVFSPIEGGVTNYLYELSSEGLVTRYITKKVNCPRLIKEGDTWYYYGVSGNLNSSSGKLNIYKAKDETFELVKGDLGDSQGNKIEPHDCLVISVNPLHYICQKYVPNQTTIVDGESKIVTSLHVEEIYEGKSVWEWHSEDYPELWVDSHYQSDNDDYLHNNTIDLDSEGNLYLNNKHANQILVIKRTWDDELHTGSIGDILWKIGGNMSHSGWGVESRIKTTQEQQWFESHDAIISDLGVITMYDNKITGASRILEFSLDTSNKQLVNFKANTWNDYRGRTMGSVDKCAEGVYLVSWGGMRSQSATNAGIYDFNTNKAIFEITFNNQGSSAYRVYGKKKSN